MSIEQSSGELLRSQVDEALHAYADVLRSKQRGEAVDDAAEFRAHVVAVVACSALVQTDDSKHGQEIFVDGLLRHGQIVPEESTTSTRWRAEQRVAYKSLHTTRTYRPDEKEIVAALLTHDPRVTVVNPQLSRR